MGSGSGWAIPKTTDAADIFLRHNMIIFRYYVDFYRNIIELKVNSYGDWAKSIEFMRHAPEFAANRIGTVFDPDRMAAEHQAGVPFERILKDIYAGKYPPTKTPDLHLPPAG